MSTLSAMSSTLLDRWEPVIGLEIHLQQSTRTKMFCRCKLEFGAKPNTHVCPVCLAHPGVLPVPNQTAVDYAIMIGLALGCEIAEHTTFSRKNYFYADSPKAYQISQYEDPICGEGHLDVPDGAGGTFRVGITRAHLEEDAAKLIHAGASGRIADSSHSFVDFNRVGTPLVEVVTEPDIRTPEQAKRFLQLLKSTIETIGVSDCNMEEGSLRCDANISVRPRGSSEFGTKTELKNMNSFRFIERGIHAELARQVELLERGESIEQATMHFDPASGTIRQLRSKEAAHDYRYFPEPDLVPIEVTREHVERIGAQMVELPMARMARFEAEYGLSAYDAEVLNIDKETADFFEQSVTAAEAADAKLIANWTMGELLALRKEDKDVSPVQLASLVDLVANKTISGAVGKELLVRIADDGIDPVQVVEQEGLAQVSDANALRNIIDGILDANPSQVEQYKSGKEALVGFFVGQVMKAMQGKADPAAAKELIVEMLAER